MLVSLDTAAGSVWECSRHGVIDWYFEATAAHPRTGRFGSDLRVR